MGKKSSIWNLFGIFNFLKKNECGNSAKRVDLSDLYNRSSEKSIYAEYVNRANLAEKSGDEIDDLETFLSGLEYLTCLEFSNFVALIEEDYPYNNEHIIEIAIQKFLNSPKGYEKLTNVQARDILTVIGLDNIIAIFDEKYGYDPYEVLSAMLKQVEYNDPNVTQGLILFFAKQERKKYWKIASEKDGLFNFQIKENGYLTNAYYADMIYQLQPLLDDENAIRHFTRQEGEDFCPQELLNFLKEEFEVELIFDQGEENFFETLPSIPSEKLDSFFQKNSMERINFKNLREFSFYEVVQDHILENRIRTMFAICPRALSIYLKYHDTDDVIIEREMLKNNLFPEQRITEFGIASENIDLLLENFSADKLIEFISQADNVDHETGRITIDFIKNFGKEYTMEEIEAMKLASLESEEDDDEPGTKIRSAWHIFLSSYKYASDYIKRGGKLSNDDLIFLFNKSREDLIMEYHKLNNNF